MIAVKVSKVEQQQRGRAAALRQADSAVTILQARANVALTISSKSRGAMEEGGCGVR